MQDHHRGRAVYFRVDEKTYAEIKYRAASFDLSLKDFFMSLMYGPKRGPRKRKMLATEQVLDGQNKA